MIHGIQPFHILRTRLDEKTNRIYVQLGDVRGETYVDNAEWVQHVGFASLPSQPVKSKAAASGIVIEDRSHADRVIASMDTRGRQLYANLKPGETALYAAGEDGNSQARFILKGNGSLVAYTTTTNTTEGEAVYSRVKPDGFEWIAPWGVMRFDATGFHVLHASGASLAIGAVGGLPAPFDAITSYATMSAGTVSLDGTATSAGGDDVALASAPAVVALLSSVQSQLGLIAAALVGLGKVGVNGTAAGPEITAATTAVTTATNGLAAGLLAVGTTTTAGAS